MEADRSEVDDHLGADLFPRPQTIRRLDDEAPNAGTPVLVEHDESIPAQGYKLTYCRSGIRINHSDPAGLRYAQQTLDQLRSRPIRSQAAVEIEDLPDFSRRGFMLDISRDRVPTRRQLLRLIEILSLGRINHLELYMENTYAYRDHEPAWRDSSPLDSADIQWLDRLCAKHGIDLVANQNTFGHWERWFEHNEYLWRAESVDGYEIMGEPRPPSTLAPTTENARFVNGLLQELLPQLRSHRLNIGADETWELGRGASRKRASEIGLPAVYLDYLLQVATPWLDEGYEVEFWADIICKYPALIPQIPENLIPVVWQYESPGQIEATLARMTNEELALQSERGTYVGTPDGEAGFRDRSKSLTDVGQRFWVAPGTSTWNSFIGRLDNCIANIIDAAEVGYLRQAEGLINTAWGDHGMWDPPVISFGPILFGAAASWGLQANRDIDLARILDDCVFHDSARVMGGVLTSIGAVDRELGTPVFNGTVLFRALLQAGRLGANQYPTEAALTTARTILAKSLHDLDAARPAAGMGDEEVSQIRQAVEVALFSVDVLASGVLTREATASDALHAQELLARFESLIESQRQAWQMSSRPGGLERSLHAFDATLTALNERAQFAEVSVRTKGTA